MYFLAGTGIFLQGKTLIGVEKGVIWGRWEMGDAVAIHPLVRVTLVQRVWVLIINNSFVIVEQ